MVFSEQQLRALPKLELHIHLEGTFDLDTMCRLAEKNGVSLPRPREKLISFSGLSEFLDLLDWICSLAREKTDARDLAYHFAEYAKAQGIVYAEVMVNPSHWKNLAVGDVVSGILEGFDQAGKAGLPDCRLLVSLRREQSAVSAENTVEWVLSHQHPRLLGLSADGNEALATDSNRHLAPLFARAREAGLGITVHAGESSGPEGVMTALDCAGAQRIDHGVRAVEDAELLKRLRESHIPLNVCFTSNVVGGLYSAETHPLKRMYDEGLLVTVNTDDPMLLEDTLCQELSRVAEQYDWSMEDLVRLQYHAITAAFCTEEEKERLRDQLHMFEAEL